MSTAEEEWVSEDEVALSALAKESWVRAKAIEAAMETMCIKSKYPAGSRYFVAFRYHPLYETHIAVCFPDECALVRKGEVIDYCCTMDYEDDDLTIKWQRALLDHDIDTLRAEMASALGILSQTTNDS